MMMMKKNKARAKKQTKKRLRAKGHYFLFILHFHEYFSRIYVKEKDEKFMKIISPRQKSIDDKKQNPLFIYYWARFTMKYK
jgi:hypothetical protein